MSSTSSLLAKPVVDGLLKVARGNLERDGYLIYVLILKFVDGRGFTVELRELMSAADSEQKRAILSRLGRQLRNDYGDIKEAILILEIWYVNARQQDMLSTSPSEHPGRQEAICICGRNADNTRSTGVIQPFTRDANNRPVWGKLAIASYNRPPTDRSYWIGLPDYLFEGVLS